MNAFDQILAVIQDVVLFVDLFEAIIIFLSFFGFTL